ncbi:hypothetical protein [Geminicoccus roseus]|nr:hypothetical protein [Geminicoccus roseus]
MAKKRWEFKRAAITLMENWQPQMQFADELGSKHQAGTSALFEFITEYY